MKKLVLTILACSMSLAAQTGPQPLFISNINFIPNGCGAVTSSIEVTASGGQPSADGSYTYDLQGSGLPPVTMPTALFSDVSIAPEYSLVVTDSAQNQVTYSISLDESQTPMSMNISLPLGNGRGCITLTATNPGNGNPSTTVVFTLDANDQSVSATKEKAPFTQTFSSLAMPSSTTITAVITVNNDCANNTSIDFFIGFPFPQGMGNALKAYIFNKYCSCALSSSTIPLNSSAE